MKKKSLLLLASLFMFLNVTLFSQSNGINQPGSTLESKSHESSFVSSFGGGTQSSFLFYGFPCHVTGFGAGYFHRTGINDILEIQYENGLNYFFTVSSYNASTLLSSFLITEHRLGFKISLIKNERSNLSFLNSYNIYFQGIFGSIGMIDMNAVSTGVKTGFILLGDAVLKNENEKFFYGLGISLNSDILQTVYGYVLDTNIIPICIMGSDLTIGWEIKKDHIYRYGFGTGFDIGLGSKLPDNYYYWIYPDSNKKPPKELFAYLNSLKIYYTFSVGKSYK